jgi:hypothetical protein
MNTVVFSSLTTTCVTQINGELISAYQELSAVMLPIEGAQALVTAVAKENQAMEQVSTCKQKHDLAVDVVLTSTSTSFATQFKRATWRMARMPSATWRMP